MPRKRVRFGPGRFDWSAHTQRIKTAVGKEFIFEIAYGKILMLAKDGEPILTMPSKNSPFWPAIKLWFDQGKRVDIHCNCVFEYPKWRKEAKCLILKEAE